MLETQHNLMFILSTTNVPMLLNLSITPLSAPAVRAPAPAPAPAPYPNPATARTATPAGGGPNAAPAACCNQGCPVCNPA
jgi:hypothetical protein